jgi:serine/threonine-protein kinase
MNVGDDSDVVKVLDFGIAARKESTDAKKEAKLTQQGMVLGTPPYMSPEQFMGKELNLRSDIYSLGVMTYEMLTGKLPFDANTPWEWATKHMTAQPFPFEDMPTTSDIPGKMKNAIFRALAKNPEERQESAKAFFEELRAGGDASRLSMVSTPVGTGAMASHDVGRLQSGTQVGMPLHDMGSVPSIPSPMPMPMPGVPAVPQPPPPAAAGGSGPNKSMIYGLMGVVGLLVLVAGGMLISRMGKKDSSTALHLDPNATGAGPATVTALPPSTVPGLASVAGSDSANPPSTAPRPTSTTTTAATTSAKPAALSGDAACSEATRQANSNINGALANYRNCSGPGKDGARRNIAGAIPGAVQSAVFRGDCKGARSIAASGGQVGAAPINVDQKYPQCKGK